jgi:hypothetical protein
VTAVVMRCAGALFSPPPGVKIPVGAYLKNYDPDYDRGLGWVEWTALRSQAMVFESFAAAVRTWQVTSAVRPQRADGLPNRPLTAFLVTYEEAAAEGARR